MGQPDLGFGWGTKKSFCIDLLGRAKLWVPKTKKNWSAPSLLFARGLLWGLFLESEGLCKGAAFFLSRSQGQSRPNSQSSMVSRRKKENAKGQPRMAGGFECRVARAIVAETGLELHVTLQGKVQGTKGRDGNWKNPLPYWGSELEGAKPQMA